MSRDTGHRPGSVVPMLVTLQRSITLPNRFLVPRMGSLAQLVVTGPKEALRPLNLRVMVNEAIRVVDVPLWPFRTNKRTSVVALSSYPGLSSEITLLRVMYFTSCWVDLYLLSDTGALLLNEAGAYDVDVFGRFVTPIN